MSVRLLLALLLAFPAVGCASTRGPLALHPEPVAQRRMQTRRYDTTDEQRILDACVALMQDHDFHVEASEPQLGILVGSTRKSALQFHQLALSATGTFFGFYVPYDTHQLLRLSIVTRPIEDQVTVRATFQRIIFNSGGMTPKREQLNDPKDYQEFFALLSRSLFLEGLEVP